MDRTAALSFLTDWSGSECKVVPAIDSIPLTELISTFEREHGFQPDDGYGGLIPQHYDYGPLGRYFMADFDHDSHWKNLGGVWVLGCECGEVGCWPLQCRIRSDGRNVTWDNFKQPHRPGRDYSQFGPFIFVQHQYEAAVANLSEELTSKTPSNR
jgi:hypothetical protein